MNITDAYRLYMGSSTVRNMQYRGALSISYELLEQMLEVPSGVHIRAIQPNMFTNSLDVLLQSETEVRDVTFPIDEGMMTPYSNLQAFMDFLSQ